LAPSLLADRDSSNLHGGEALQELPLDPPERYQAQLTGVPGVGRPVVPGNSGLEISAGQKGRPDPRDQGWRQTLGDIF